MVGVTFVCKRRCVHAPRTHVDVLIRCVSRIIVSVFVVSPLTMKIACSISTFCSAVLIDVTGRSKTHAGTT